MSTTSTYLEQLLTLLPTVTSNQGWNWLYQAQQRLPGSTDPFAELTQLSAQVRRRLGEQRLALTPLPIVTAAGTLDIANWTATTVGRVILLLTTIQTQPDHAVDWITALYHQGDESERIAVMQGLSLFPDGPALKPLALENGRVNSLPLFAALALANPYPAAYYSEAEFNQLVLKGLFLGLSIATLSGLTQRGNPDLSRMCEDYLDERLAAGRPLPADLWLALGPYASPRGEQRLIEYASHTDPRHRYYAALALQQRQVQHPTARQALAERLTLETEADILTVLRQSAPV